MHGLFQPAVDAHFDVDTRRELVVWGSGENIDARYRQRCTTGDGPSSVSWHHVAGAKNGYSPGYDDVKSIVIVNRQVRDQDLGILVGRDNGDVSLLSAAQDNFGKCLANLSPDHADQPLRNVSQRSIMSLDVLDGLVAATTRAGVLLYRLPQPDVQLSPSLVGPVEYYGLEENVFDNKNVNMGHAKWMGDTSMMATALRGSKEPLRYLSLTPTGWVSQVAAKNAHIERQFGIGYGNICPSSLQPVRLSANLKGTSLLLSSWRDGTCR
jgi:hypothetical protein